MSEMQAPDQPYQHGQTIAPIASPKMMKPSVFGTRIPSAVMFGIGLLLFLMPFIDIRCNSLPIKSISGAELATGFKIEAPGSDHSVLGNLGKLNSPNEPGTSTSHSGNPYALAAIVIAALGFVLSMINFRASAASGIITGSLSAVALIALMVQLRGEVNQEVGSGDVMISVIFTPFFYISILSFLAAAFFSYRRLTLPRPVKQSNLNPFIDEFNKRL